MSPFTLFRTDDRRKGAVAPLFALLLPVLFLLSGFAINLAYMQLLTTELKIATDAAAHAGGRAMSIHQTTDAAYHHAHRIAALNRVGGQSVHVPLPSVGEYVPAGRSKHVLLELAPVAVEYLPASHEVHSKDPLWTCKVTVTVADRYDPSSQGQQLTPLEVSIRTVSAPSTDTTPAGSASASRILLILGQLSSSPPVVR